MHSEVVGNSTVRRVGATQLNRKTIDAFLVVLSSPFDVSLRQKKTFTRWLYRVLVNTMLCKGLVDLTICKGSADTMLCTITVNKS
jgi:hypothetical protein